MSLRDHPTDRPLPYGSGQEQRELVQEARAAVQGEHAFRRAPGRPAADPRCGACGRRQSEHAVTEVARAIAAKNSPRRSAAPSPMLPLEDWRARYMPLTPAKRLRALITSGAINATKIGGLWFLTEAEAARLNGGGQREPA